LRAVRSFVYWSAPCPAFTTLIFTAGYFFSNSATSCAMFGTQVQKVRVVGVVIALSMSAWPIGPADAVVFAAVPEQADRARTEAASAAANRQWETLRDMECSSVSDGRCRRPGVRSRWAGRQRPFSL